MEEALEEVEASAGEVAAMARGSEGRSGGDCELQLAEGREGSEGRASLTAEGREGRRARGCGVSAACAACPPSAAPSRWSLRAGGSSPLLGLRASEGALHRVRVRVRVRVRACEPSP